MTGAADVASIARRGARIEISPDVEAKINAARSLGAIGGYGGVLKGYDHLSEAALATSFVDSVRAVWQRRRGVYRAREVAAHARSPSAKWPHHHRPRCRVLVGQSARSRVCHRGFWKALLWPAS